jgi:alcohol dehydrogenase YqhD (iron-dependent ADH family)
LFKVLIWSGEVVFGVTTGTLEEKAMAFITKLRKFIQTIRIAAKVTDWPGAKIEPEDDDLLTERVMAQKAGKPFGANRF